MIRNTKSPNPFTTRYQTLDNVDLVAIIDNPDDYQPLAVEAAKLELAYRNLSDEQLSKAYAALDIKDQEVYVKEQKAKHVEHKIKSVGASIFDLLHPMEKGKINPDKTITLISIFIGAFFIIQIYSNYGLVRMMFIQNENKLDSIIISMVAPLLVIPIVGLLIWKRNKIGWIIATIFSTNFGIIAIWSFLSSFTETKNPLILETNISPYSSIAVLILAVVIFNGLSYTLCRTEITNTFKVNKLTMQICLSIGVGLGLIGVGMDVMY